ncbi:glycosyltransferase family 2 protein [Maribacter antarcticus]|uniref:glycosyltransferase family 2 protein n=1 Tax=Maribacter antarcticus TaxID=505250 RepID=UPI00047D50FB|nr:glycosyltransferase family 2 protein [Maribacter antarcticus]
MDYYVIIPAHNEAEYLTTTLDSLANQSLRPKKVVVVNDNSEDTTGEIIASYIAKDDIFHTRPISSSAEHMPGSKVIQAFNCGLELVDDTYDFIVKLDADVILPLNYFEQIAKTFKINPKTGIAGGFIYEQNQHWEWQLNHPMNKQHVRGAFKAYSKSCFKAIGGLKSAMGWDTVDELLAQYHGFNIHTDDALKVKHLRPTGTAYNKKARGLQGQAMFAMRYGFWICLIASIKMTLKQKNWTAFTDNMKGFFEAKKNKVPFLVSQNEGVFIRKLRWTNMRRKIST